MMCEKCGKYKATTYIKKVINGVSQEVKLCPTCAKNFGYNTFSNNSFAGFLSSMFGEYELPQNSKTCECCGSTFNDIAKNGKVGCSKCYDTFTEELLPYLKRLHGNVKHVGKMPNMSPLAVSTVADRINALRNELNTLVKNEEFEKAAKVRDQIKELEGKVNGDEQK